MSYFKAILMIWLNSIGISVQRTTTNEIVSNFYQCYRVFNRNLSVDNIRCKTILDFLVLVSIAPCALLQFYINSFNPGICFWAISIKNQFSYSIFDSADNPAFFLQNDYISQGYHHQNLFQDWNRLIQNIYTISLKNMKVEECEFQ